MELEAVNWYKLIWNLIQIEYNNVELIYLVNRSDCNIYRTRIKYTNQHLLDLEMMLKELFWSLYLYFLNWKFHESRS